MRPAPAAARPSRVRSGICAELGKAPIICSIIRPAEVVVSICSVSDWKPTCSA